MPFNRLHHSILGEIRPRFALKIECDPEEAIQHVEQGILNDKTVSGVRANSTIFLKTPSWLAHYWSPEMTVRIEKSEITGNVLVNCMLGPRQAVWAMFALIYAAIILITGFAGMFGLVQYQTTGSSPFLYVIPVGLAAFSTVFISAKIGQRKGRDQILHLVSFLYHSLSEISSVERVKH